MKEKRKRRRLKMCKDEVYYEAEERNEEDCDVGGRV
jgi:hypothetical protein